MFKPMIGSVCHPAGFLSLPFINHDSMVGADFGFSPGPKEKDEISDSKLAVVPVMRTDGK